MAKPRHTRGTAALLVKKKKTKKKKKKLRQASAQATPPQPMTLSQVRPPLLPVFLCSRLRENITGAFDLGFLPIYSFSRV